MSKRRKLALSVVSILMIICIVIAVSYAIWTRKLTQTGTNVNTYDCLDITYEETTENIAMMNSYPMKDEIGLTQKPYTVKISNKCNYFVNYQVNINELSTNTLDAQYVKIAINDNLFLLNSKSSVTPTLSGTDAAWNVSSGIVGPNNSRNIETKMWMDYNTTKEQGFNKEFKFKITIETITGSNSKTLASAIIKNNKFRTVTPNFSKGEPPESGTNTGSGLYAAEDDYGTSYYLRGAINNNYVSFANNIWRLVRINGDGSIRLIANEIIAKSAFNTIQQGHQYEGYTYGNNSACTKASPCISKYDSASGKFTNNKRGTNSTIKEYLENIYYKTNLLDYDNLIAQGSYCNDTTNRTRGDINYYGGYDRIKTGDPSLKCEDTSE